MSIKNRFNFWFEIFDKNDDILMTKSNIDFEFIVEHDDNHIYLIYKFIYRFHKQSNKQSRIAIDDFYIQKNNVDRLWDLTLLNLRVEYIFNNVFTSMIFIYQHANQIRQIMNESNFITISSQISRSIKKLRIIVNNNNNIQFSQSIIFVNVFQQNFDNVIE